MAIGLEDKQNVNPADADFPFGDVRDKTSSEAGTRWDRNTMSDYIQFFHKMLDEAGITPNGTLDNDSNGWQMYEAFRKLTRPYKLYAAKLVQSSTSAPTVTEYFNDFGNIVWTRQTGGVYRGTLTGAFAGKRAVLVSPATNASTIISASSTDDYVTINTYDLDLGAGSTTLTDGLLIQGYIEVKVFD